MSHYNNQVESKSNQDTPSDFIPATAEELESVLAMVEEHSGSRYLMVHQDHMRLLKGDGCAAILLAFYMNDFRMKTQSSGGRTAVVKNGLWFKSMSVTIQKQLGMSYKKVRRAAKTLEESGVLSVRHWRGNAIWVKFNDLGDLTSRLSQNQIVPKGQTRLSQRDKLDCPKGTNSINKKDTNKKDTNKKGPAPDGALLPPRRNTLLPEPPSEPPQEDTVAAQQFKDALRRNNRVTRSSVKTDAESLRLLRTKDKIDYAEVLQLYGDNCDIESIDRLGLPFCENCRQFRKHYEWIRSRLAKAGKLGPTAPAVEVSPAAAAVVQKLTDELSWPKGSSLQLPAVVQASIDNYKSFRKRFQHVRDTVENEKLRRLAEEVDGYLHRSDIFVEEWFREIHTKYKNWGDWSGWSKLKPFHEDDPEFARRGAEWAEIYCGDVDRWTRLFKLVKEASK